MAGSILRSAPPYVAQRNVNSCWAAVLEMWFCAELGYQYWTQAQLINSAGDFTIGPSGINLDGMQQVINDATSIGTIQMYTKVVQSPSDVPQVPLILDEVGFVFLAFTRQDGLGGHVNLLIGSDGSSTYDAVDPNPGIMQTTRDQSFYFSKFPGLVGWRMTSSMPSVLNWTGRPPWDYL
jgi:hypothetical protein